MGVVRPMWDAVVKHVPYSILKDVVSFGYPDILVDSPSDILNDSRSEEICKYHAIKQRPLISLEKWCEVNKATLTVYDKYKVRGTEREMDLNVSYIKNPDYPFHAQLVIDPGTLEHCFHITNALQNMSGMVAVGGIIVHWNPLNMINHGFYNLNPTFYHDFYTANGFEILEMKFVHGVPQQDQWSEFPLVGDDQHHRQLVNATNFTSNLVIAKRKEVVPFTVPTQTKYKRRFSE